MIFTKLPGDIAAKFLEHGFELCPEVAIRLWHHNAMGERIHTHPSEFAYVTPSHIDLDYDLICLRPPILGGVILIRKWVYHVDGEFCWHEPLNSSKNAPSDIEKALALELLGELI